MPRSLLRLLCVVAFLVLSSLPAFALVDELGGDNAGAKLINAQMTRDMRSEVARTGMSGVADTTYLGFVPGKVTATNYWGLGIGNFKVFSSNAADYGYWGWDNDALHDNIGEVHGDSLFGWWPIRNIVNGTGGLTLADDQRPWWAIDIGNDANYVISQGTGHRRTTGVVGVWHRDNGSISGGGVTWAPLDGSFSLWCGLRREGDNSFVDPITNNPFNDRIMEWIGFNGGTNTHIGPPYTGGIGTNKKYPGYGSQWDQLAYRDLDVTGKPSVTLRFLFRTNMSTGYGTTAASRVGWFDKDPLNHLAPNNFISSTAAGTAAPIDSFMVYVGAPVGTTFVGSDGLTHNVFDPQRRWLSETIRVNEPGIPYQEVFTTYGDNPVNTVTTVTALVDPSWDNRARVVFRNKTNRGFDDDGGSVAGAYSSGGAGAVVIDDVQVSYTGAGGPFNSIGDFETTGQVDNDAATDPLNAWKTTGKPPGAFHHVHSIDQLVYQDICGPVGGIQRTCNLAGNVISMGDHDNSEAAGGAFGTAEQERWDGIFSPTINLRNGGGMNEMGINDAIADATEDFYIDYDIYTGIFDPFTQGNLWRFGFQSYPGTQVDGVPCWGDLRFPGIIIFNPDKQCFQDQEAGFRNAIIRWNTTIAENGVNYPDSIRFFIGKRQECYRFGVTTGCSSTDGAYLDNISLAFVDGVAPPMTIDIWQLINDTFTVNGLNRNGVAPGSANFDTTAALIKTGLNIAQTTGNTSRYDVPGDTTVVNADGANFRIDMIFRISPGPGNYVTVGNRSSGLRRVPTNPTAVSYLSASNNGNFWAEYLRDNGEKGTPGGHPAGATNGGKDWSPLVWNSARCDTAEANFWLISARTLGGPVLSLWATMYHESDPKFTKLGLAKNRCWLKDPTAPNTFANTTCNITQTLANWPVTAGYVAENGLPLGQTYEYTKILPDGYFTPGTHVEYFFRREDSGISDIPIAPDTNLVFPQISEGSRDGHRWQEFTVLPDAWKKVAYGGLGQACLLFVDNNDRRGDELVWVSITDSLGGTRSNKYGAHNGWHAAGNGVDVNNPSGFVRNLNEAPGTTWDMLGVKACESLNTNAGSIGSDYANHAPSNVDGKWSFEGPSIGMLEAYYKVIFMMTGDLNSGILGPFNNKSQDDVRMLREFMLGGISSDHRGVWVEGDGFVEDTDQSGATQADLLHSFFKTSLRDPSYFALTNVASQCTDLQALAPITNNGDIYGVRNGCTFTNDVLTPGVGGVAATLYSPNGSAVPPLVAGVFHDVNPVSGEFWQSLIDGFDVRNLRSRFCDTDPGRLAYYLNVTTNIFAKLCPGGGPFFVADVPNNSDGSVFVDFMDLRNNPLVSGEATVDFGLAKADRVEVKVFDVSGRLVRTLTDRSFAAGRHSLTWDGVDNEGRAVPRGVYFTQVKYVNRRFTDARKLIVIK